MKKGLVAVRLNRKCAVCGDESYHDKYCSWTCEQKGKGIKPSL